MKDRFSRAASTLLVVAFALCAGKAAAQTAYGVSPTNNLVTFSVTTPGTIASSVPITGLGGGETVLGIDFRTATGELLALGSLSRLYVINPVTGAATQIGSSGSFTLSGTAFGFDVNPTVDRVRVTSDADQNLRLNPNNGAIAGIDTALTYASGDPNFGANPNVVGSAYTNNFPGTTTTTLYGIDSNLDILVIQNPPNSGLLNTVGSLGVNASAVLGFDIFSPGSASNIGYASLVVGGVSGLYTINLATGAATLVGAIGGPTTLNGLAIAPTGQLRFSASGYNVNEGSMVTVIVQRVGGSTGAIGATVSTADASATAPGDYSAVSVPVAFGDGDVTPKSVVISTVNDALPENVETFSVSLSAATGGTTLGPLATVYIIDDEIPPDVAYGVDAATNSLVSLYLQAPAVILSSIPITGLAGGETVLGIDFRPATGELLALGSGSHLYSINTASAAATAIGSAGAFTLSGTAFGFDVNPSVDRVRLTSDADQNLRLNPNNGALAGLDTALSYAPGDPNFGADPNVVGSAYTNNVAGTATTALYGIDSNLDVLVIQNPPNAGLLSTVGPLGVDTTAVLGFDITTKGGVNFAYASMVVGGIPGLYSIDLPSGAATFIGAIGGNTTLSGLAIAVGALPGAPVITSPSTTTFVVGVPGSFTVTATGSPTPTFSLSGALPAGLTFNSLTGVLSGTPSAGSAGVYNVVITAANGVLPNATQALTINVVAGAPGSVTPIPTLSETALLLLMMALSVAGALLRRRRA